MILAILQARLSSSRLPGKVLKPILGKPMLIHQIERIRRSKLIDELVVATSCEESDDQLEHCLKQAGCKVYRGDLSDVLSRFCGAAQQLPEASTIVRLTGDCPLTDWNVLDAAIAYFKANSFDYVSNADPATWPDGLDVEVMTRSALFDAGKHAKLKSDREHVTSYIRNNKQHYRIGTLLNDEDLSALRWTVDEPEDFAFVTKVYDRLYSSNPNFATKEILDLIAVEPDLIQNSHLKRNEGYLKSLANDRNAP
ncbi:cytidylyltransferase domain-containing protein [Pseudovibrio sp. JE062]|uniref:cytidylyltransferase domain-containing protein n=1 Tax=Pseudovibrio sp. JE062 TaxID=439495 RepID=UPI000186F657|nr:glycosyltransferase family protein [Pseudovibrio sp. JE062]EEA93264.1 flagellin modification protein FlmC [Pseudovibrio sp. JE062]